MALGELDVVGRFVLAFSQVKYQEIFGLVNYKKLAQSSHEFTTSSLALFGGKTTIFIEEQRAPLNLHYWELARMVPNCNRCCVVIVKHPVES